MAVEIKDALIQDAINNQDYDAYKRIQQLSYEDIETSLLKQTKSTEINRKIQSAYSNLRNNGQSMFINGHLAELERFGPPKNIEDPQPSFDFYFRELSHQENKIFNELAADYRKMNIDGMKEAARNIKIIAGNPVFQRITSPRSSTEDTPEPPRDLSEHNDTAKEKKPPEDE